MNAAEFIQTGILEAYILGATTPGDELLLSLFWEDALVQTKLCELADTLQLFDLENAIPAPRFPGLE